MIRRTTVGLVGAALALATACGDAGSDRAGGTRPQPARTVTMANFGGDSGDLDQFIQEVRRRSHGSLRIDVRNFWRRGDPAAEKAVIGDVRAGRADIAAVGSRAWDAAGVPTLRALAAPLLIDSYAYEERVLRDPVVAHMLDGVRRAGLAPLGVLPGALRRPLGATGPLLGPADYRGRRIGLTASPVGAATLRALGATPVPYAVATSIDGLDGAEAQIVAISGNRYDRHAKYLTANVALWPRPLVVFAGRRVWDSLTGDQRAALTGASAAVLEPDLARVRAEEHDDGQTLCRRHVRFLTATRADTTALRRAVQPVYTALERDPDTRRSLARIAALRPPGDNAGDPVRCTEPSPEPARARPTAIDGVWRMVTAPGDHAPGEPDASPSNYGTWTYVFRAGRFAFTQHNALACGWGYGAYAVRGNHVSWTFADGGGRAPDQAYNKPGEYFIFGWSMYRDRLALTAVPGAVSPENFRARDWRRLGRAGGLRDLDARCRPPARALG